MTSLSVSRKRRSSPSVAERVLRVIVVGPQGVGGQAHAARDIVAGFAGHRSVHVEFQPIDPRLPDPWRFLTEWKFLRSVVRPLLYCRELIPRLVKIGAHLLKCSENETRFEKGVVVGPSGSATIGQSLKR